MKQLNGFSASKYQPEQWVNLIKESGAKYAVITQNIMTEFHLEFKGRKDDKHPATFTGKKMS
jgi:alpha-L-fucosidase